MCGIAGIIASGTERPDEFLTTALKLQRHRGPDAEDRLVNGHIGVCHSRLSIIDLEGGRQPMLFEHWAIVFNGEIYNYKELRTDLQGKGFTFDTQSDTEVILKGYVHYGTDILPMLRGMFAFCIWNRRESSMFLARDPFGIKPVHYFSAGGTFAFSSEINPLAAQFKRSLQVDTQAIDAFLTLQYIPSPYTIFRHVHKLPPGSWMKVDTNGIITKRGIYFDIATYTPIAVKLASYAEAKEYLREVLTDSVRAHMVSDVEVGTFLSGGIDSTLVTQLAQGMTPTQIHTFSIGFPEAEYDESAYALEAAKHIGTRHHAHTVQGITPEEIRAIALAYGEPYGDSSSIPTFFVSRLAAQHVKVCLTGDGSDEMFFGYSRYFGWLNKTRRYTDIPRWKQEYVKWMRKFAPERYGPLPDEPLFSRWLSTVQFMPQEERARFWKQPMGANHILEAVQTSYERLDGSPMQRARRMEIGYYLNNDILTKVDIASMLNSLETRPPFTDMRVLDAALNISEAHLYKADMDKGTFVGKAIVKDLLSDSFGNQFLHRPKMGFGMPLDKWLFEKGEVNDYLQAELMTGKLLDLFDKNEICGRLSGTVTSPAGKSGPLWTLTMLHEWLKGV